jgi:starvation-inducible DNA-binding protein
MDREAVSRELQPLLVELTDLHLTAKQAHWNVTGPLFVPQHQQLDALTADARTWADDVAERLVAIGIPADARAETVVAQAALPSVSEGFIAGDKVVALVVEHLDAIVDRTRRRIEHLDGLDLVSQDLVIGIEAGLEKHRWMWSAQTR